ncbi:MAG TPA: transporter substrate-binding domain-containing protein [Microvirga sp.]|jgi:polar amino acid transport system substrate-binding protein/arginine/ornithine transport system substrate-binding protein|nr:transporter substrate-binding domain-containing protein [Microvirga sp.]
MFRTLGLAAVLAVAFAASAGAQTKIRVGVEGNYPPFSQISPDGKLSGFDIDIANAVCAEMKVECTLVQQEFDSIIPALNAKKFDMIVASMTITDERKKSVEFSDSYYDVPSRWVAKKGAFKEHSAEALKGKKIIVARNTPRAKHVADNYPGSETLLVNKETDVYLELAAGRGDIGFGSSVVSAESFLKKEQGKDFETVGQPVRVGLGAGVGIAVRKNETELRDKINAALKTIKANGTYKSLQDKYFDFDISGGA